jgi:hypothetical protein
MKDKYTPGQDCKCSAYSESECGCDVDWTPAEVYELREQLKSERALADRLAEALTNPATYVALEALTAWKEARSE